MLFRSLADLAMDALRAAVEAGEEKRPAEERRLTQARRAVEKAAVPNRWRVEKPPLTKLPTEEMPLLIHPDTAEAAPVNQQYQHRPSGST